jgi:hypothetical protein
VADVLSVAALEVGDPVALLVLVEGDDFAERWHGEEFHHRSVEFTEGSVSLGDFSLGNRGKRCRTRREECATISVYKGESGRAQLSGDVPISSELEGTA